ncbi:MAG: type I DNA topoisomerase [Anaerolineae bacterium]|nr:type I DNA topoisomerase [Anaerolineae bacterium]
MGQTDEPITGYCVRCRQKQEIAGAQAVFLGEQGRPATQGACPVCGTRLVRFGRTPAHDALDPAAHTIASRAAERRLATGPKLVIVESPAKARTIGRFLGRGYRVEPSVGHVRDLPANRMGVDVEHDFAPRYVIPEKKKEVVKRLQNEARQASEVYLATDPDREGEAIAWHLAAALERQLRGVAVHRVEFHEITKEAIDRAFAQPRQISQERVDAQQARRILDRVVGFTLSPLLRDKMGRKGLSAGRVQSVALRLVCEREREVEAFVPVEYWTIEAELKKRSAISHQLSADTRQQAGSFVARLAKVRGEDPDLGDQAAAQAVVDDLQRSSFAVDQVGRQERRRSPAPPFITSTLQQEASRKLGFTAQRTMAVAQALYEGKEVGDGEQTGLITYMRTDSVHVAESAQAQARQVIGERFGPAYLPDQPPQYKTRVRRAQEAHEAVRPTSAWRDPASLRRSPASLNRDELRLYTLIWQRFVASQMAPAVLEQTTVDVAAGPAPQDRPYLLRAVGSEVKFPGFLRVYEQGRDEAQPAQDEERKLPPLHQGEQLDLVQLLPGQHFTEPPPRYTDAALIRALEEYGIGRPSTYAPIMATLQERNYVERVQRKLIPTRIGLIVDDLLAGYFPDVVNVEFTAGMEEKLDAIAAGEQAWAPMLREFYGPFAASVEEARDKMPVVELKPEPTGELCPQCGSPLVVKFGRRGKFIGCSGWPACRYSAPIPVAGVKCPQCGAPVIQKRTRKGRPFYTCANYRPDDESACQWISWQLPKAGQG